jgi:signal transduction histidine kinase
MWKSILSPYRLLGVGLLLAGVAGLLAPGFLQGLFSPGFFMPHRHCYLDNPRMLWLHGLSDFLIGASYMAIAGELAYLVSKARKDIPFEWMFLAFGLFIFSCGWTHFMEVWTLWHPIYWLSGAIKAITAVASLATAAGVFLLMPHIFRLIETAKASEQRRQDLEKAHRELERAYQEMESFSYSISHDIRAPLRAMRSFSSLALEKYREQLGSEGVSLLEKVEGGGRRMDQLVEQVLALSRISRGQVQSEPIDVEELVRQIIQDRSDLQPPRAEVRVESPLPSVRGDPASLTQCLANLLSNAVKFVARGVAPQVRVYAEAHDDKVRLYVADNGIGIAPGAQQKIFEGFHRLHSQGEYEGSGIGLAIVRKAVERMGGRVGVESEPGKGSRFWVELRSAERR